MTEARARWLIMKAFAADVCRSPWEARFLARIDEQIERMGVASLTENQIAKLEEIGAK